MEDEIKKLSDELERLKKANLPHNKIAFRMLEAEAASGLSKASLYEQIRAGRLISRKVAGRRLILRDDLETFLRASQS